MLEQLASICQTRFHRQCSVSDIVCILEWNTQKLIAYVREINLVENIYIIEQYPKEETLPKMTMTQGKLGRKQIKWFHFAEHITNESLFFCNARLNVFFPDDYV